MKIGNTVKHIGNPVDSKNYHIPSEPLERTSTGQPKGKITL